MKKLLKEIFKIIDLENEAYEMGCLISSEFTPSPDYTEAVKLVEKSEFSKKEVNDYVGYGLL